MLEFSTPCIACSKSEFESLPIPNEIQSMLSDGKIIPIPLKKCFCTFCGMVRHETRLTEKEIAAFYDNDYGLPKQSDMYEITRAIEYSRNIVNFLGKSFLGNLLEIGCGSGFLLREMAVQNLGTSYEGFDPALVNNNFDLGDKKLVLHKSPDMKCLSRDKYNTILSINTLEHISDPILALKNIADRMENDADVILVLPSYYPANVELLFFDHLWTFTPKCLSLLLDQVGLHLVNYQNLDKDLDGFTIYHIKKENPIHKDTDWDVLSYDRYLDAWKNLDHNLNSSIHRFKGEMDIQIFGAGQMAGLLRCYAPKFYNKVSRVVADMQSNVWVFDKFQIYDDAKQTNVISLIVTHPSSEDRILTKISYDGGLAFKLSTFLLPHES